MSKSFIDKVIETLPKNTYTMFCKLNENSKKQVINFIYANSIDKSGLNEKDITSYIKKLYDLKLDSKVLGKISKGHTQKYFNYLTDEQKTEIKELIREKCESFADLKEITNIVENNIDVLANKNKEEITQLFEKAEQYVKESQDKAIKKMANELKSVNRDTDTSIKEIEESINKVSKELDNIEAEYNLQTPDKTEDIINKPNHYHKGGFDIYEIMQAKLSKEKYKGFCEGNILKYLLRAELKGKPLEDLKKLRFNVDRTIEAYEGIEYVPEYKKPKIEDTNNNGAIIYALEHLKALDEYLYMKDMHLEKEDLDINYVKAMYSRIKLLTKEASKILEGVVNYESE